MIRHSGGWLNEADLRRQVPGRHDPQELIDRCERYLTGDWTDEYPAAISPLAERKTSAELAAARVRASVQAPDKLADANATIDRLLAFMPPRAHSLSQTRLSEIVERLQHEAVQVFPDPARVVLQLREEDDSDTEACHRITVTVYLTHAEDYERTAASIERLHDCLVDSTSVEEYRAIRLLVEPWLKA